MGGHPSPDLLAVSFHLILTSLQLSRMSFVPYPHSCIPLPPPQMLLRLPLVSNPSTSRTQADHLPLCFAGNCILALRLDQMDVLCPRVPAGEKKKKKEKNRIHPFCTASSVCPPCLIPPPPTLRLKMCECPSQLPRTQPVHITAQRHKLGSQGMREVQIALLSGLASATRSKSSAAHSLWLRMGQTIAASSPWRCAVPSRSSVIVENSGQAHHPCAQSSIKHQRHCISDIIIAFCMMQ